MHLGIVAQPEDPRATGLADDLRRAVDDDVDVAVDETTAATLEIPGHPVEALADCDLVVSIGGDGTFLYAARAVAPTPMMGVNLGEVGFLNAVSPAEAEPRVREAIAAIRTGTPTLQTLPQVEATGADWSLPPALNEVAILGSRRGPGAGIDIEVRIDGELYSGSHADGVLVATPTGSTAYNLSEGGPLVHQAVEGLVVTEMAASDSMPSLVVAQDADIVVRVDGAGEAVVTGDGRSRRSITPPTTVHVALAADPVRIAGPPLEFFTALGKLH